MNLVPELMNGVKHGLPRFATRLHAESPLPVQVEPWWDFAVPTYNQLFPSCVGHATANWMEMMIRRFVSPTAFQPDEQIDGDQIWRRGRAMFWPNEPVEDGGLLMDQGFLAALDLGLLPAGTEVVRLTADLAAVAEQLAKSPVLQGTCVHKGWNKPNPENGQISFDLPDPYAGHATCIVAAQSQRVGKDGLSRYLPFQNSWGATWGRYGYGVLREDQWLNYLIDDPVTAKLPAGWEAFDGWRAFVIKVKS